MTLFLDNVAGWILELDRGRGSRGRELFLLVGTEEKPFATGREVGKREAKDSAA